MLWTKGFMNKFRKLLRSSLLGILLLPYGLFGLGAASNQAVLIANHDKFPVMMNAYKISLIDKQREDFAKIIEAITGKPAPEKIPTVADNGGMLDSVHCVMTKDTHLNALADVFDLGSTYSIGDFVLYLGEWMMGWTPWVWATLLISKVYRQEV